MSAALYREWTFTWRNRTVFLFALLLTALFSVSIAIQSDGFINPTYGALYFALVYGSNRMSLRLMEDFRGSGAVFLRTPVATVHLVGSKILIEAICAAGLVLLPLVTLVSRGASFAPIDLVHIGLAAVAIPTTLMAPVILWPSETTRLFSSILVLVPLAFLADELVALEGVRWIAFAIPLLSSMLGVREIAFDGGVTWTLTVAAVSGTVVLLPLLARHYRKSLLLAL